MKTRIRQFDSAKENGPAEMSRIILLTLDEIRQRALAISLARGGPPGVELDDWLRAEQELKRERAAAEADSTQPTKAETQSEVLKRSDNAGHRRWMAR